MKTCKCYLKILLALSLTVIIMVTPMASVYANEKTMIKSNGMYVNLIIEPRLYEDTNFIAIKDFEKILGVKTVWDATTKTAVIRKDELVLKLTIGKKMAELNEGAYNLLAAPVIYNDTPMAPISTVCKAFDAGIAWDGEKNIINITTGEQSMLKQKNDIQEGAVVFTYAEAVKRAVAINNTFRTLDESLQVIEFNLDSVSQALTPGSSLPEAALTKTIRAITTLEGQMKNVSLNEQVLKDVSELLVLDSVTSIEGYKLDIRLLEESIALEETNVKNMELKNKLGLVSDNELKSAGINLEQSKTNLSLLKINLETENQSLGRLLGTDLKKIATVIYEPTIKSVKNPNITAYVSNKIAEAPTIKIKENEVETARYKMDTSSILLDDTGMEGLDQLTTENEYEQAKRDLADAKRDMEKSILANYNKMLLMEEQAKSLELDLEKARDTYNNAVLNYEAGNIILFQLDQAKLGILKSEVEMQKNKLNYKVLEYMFEKPYLESYLSGGN